ncbi:hypothetical protein E0H71_16865 [Rhizobium leguminosarum bv. viciae]|nr:hypothetical protein E0H71_16865 [Rhizobium leguminosarum bv. viciae]TCA68281.1 hypothetical protein E0H69_31080 [Rhizobium leguminosarum bv. viciae]
MTILVRLLRIALVTILCIVAFAALFEFSQDDWPDPSGRPRWHCSWCAPSSKTPATVWCRRISPTSTGRPATGPAIAACRGTTTAAITDCWTGGWASVFLGPASTRTGRPG